MKKLLANMKFLAKPEWALLLGSVILGIIGAQMEQAHQSEFRKKIEEKMKTTTIYVANRNLEKGSIIRSENLRPKQVLVGTPTRNFIFSRDLTVIRGKKLDVDLRKGDPILISMLVTSETNRSMASKIPEHKRIYMMKLSKDQVVKNGFVQPGDYVDILSSMEFSQKGLKTFTILQRIQLLSIGKSTDPRSGVESNLISFFVTPEQMELLKFSEQRGVFSLALRNPNDLTTLSSKGIDEDSFINSDLIYRYADPAVEIHNGGKR